MSILPPSRGARARAIPAGEDGKIAVLLDDVFHKMPKGEQVRVLEKLIMPLGLLSLAAVANGVFAKLWLQSGAHASHLRLDDVGAIGPGDVADLVVFVQQVSVETVDSLAQVLATSPALVGSAAAAALIAALTRRIQARRQRSSTAERRRNKPAPG